MTDRLCHYEEERFPEDEFEASAEHGWIHKNRTPRHTIDGQVLDDKDNGGVIPGPMDQPPDPV